jgi:ADP-L-glycero-D-manno-heptose 6-epimerase
MSDQPTYVVTGGAGFVGSNVVAALLRRTPGADVIVIDDFRKGSFENLVNACEREGVGPFTGEVFAASVDEIDFEMLVRELSPAAVFHEAAITDTTVSDERLMIRENTGGFEQILSACVEADVPLVYASSAATYGSPEQAVLGVPFPCAAAGKPNNVYGFSKWLMECSHRRVQAERAERGLALAHVVGLRYFNVFGPGESFKGKMASMVYQLAARMLRWERPRIFADGTQARDQVYVKDVVGCTLAAAGLGVGDHQPRPGVYNVGSGVTTSFNEIIAALRPVLGMSASAYPTDYFKMPEDVAAFYQSYTCADLGETIEGLGWKPAYKPADAIAEYARYLLEVEDRVPEPELPDS